MKKLLLALVFLSVSLSADSFTIKRDSGKTSFSYEKKNGIYTLSNKKTFDDNVKVIISFKDDSYKKSIEKKYGLHNGEKFYAQYFIYEQTSNDIVALFAKLSKEKGIKNVYPNWNTRVSKY